MLTTDLEDLRAADVTLRYKELWQVENLFRSLKSVLQTRTIYHQSDAAIRGHVFCSFLALVLLSELQRRMAERGWRAEWKPAAQRSRCPRGDLSRRQRSALRDPDPHGRAGRQGDQAAGVALGPTVRFVDARDGEADL